MRHIRKWTSGRTPLLRLGPGDPRSGKKNDVDQFVIGTTQNTFQNIDHTALFTKWLKQDKLPAAKELPHAQKGPKKNVIDQTF